MNAIALPWPVIRDDDIIAKTIAVFGPGRWRVADCKS